MFSLLGIIDGAIKLATGIFTKKMDVDLEKYKVKGQVDVEALRQDTEIIKARAELAQATKDDNTTKWGKRLFVYPVGVWFALVVYVSCFMHHPWFKDYVWEIAALPKNLDYITYAIIAYLFVTAWKK